MKNRILGVFLAVTVILQLAFPSYFLFDALERENKIYQRGDEYILSFSEIYALGGKDYYRFNYEDNCYVENPDTAYPDTAYNYIDDRIYYYDNLAVAKGENGETLFFNADTLSEKQLETMDLFPDPYKKIELNFDDYEFCGSIKSEEEFYCFIIEKSKEFYADEKLIYNAQFPSFEEYKNNIYSEYANKRKNYYTQAIAAVDGTLTVKIQDGELKVTKLHFGDELILKIKDKAN